MADDLHRVHEQWDRRRTEGGTSAYASNRRYETMRRERDEWKRKAEDKMEDLSRNSFLFGGLCGATAAVLLISIALIAWG